MLCIFDDILHILNRAFNYWLKCLLKLFLNARGERLVDNVSNRIVIWMGGF